MENIEKVIEIYDEYSYLLTEKQHVEEWVKPRGAIYKRREEYLKEIKRYREIYLEVAENVPFYVRCNMINICGTDLKKKYLDICTDIG